MNAIGVPENKTASKTGGGIAKEARIKLESKTGKKIVTKNNYLLPQKLNRKLIEEEQDI